MGEYERRVLEHTGWEWARGVGAEIYLGPKGGDAFGAYVIVAMSTALDWAYMVYSAGGKQSKGGILGIPTEGEARERACKALWALHESGEHPLPRAPEGDAEDGPEEPTLIDATVTARASDAVARAAEAADAWGEFLGSIQHIIYGGEPVTEEQANEALSVLVRHGHQQAVAEDPDANGFLLFSESGPAPGGVLPVSIMICGGRLTEALRRAYEVMISEPGVLPANGAAEDDDGTVWN